MFDHARRGFVLVLVFGFLWAAIQPAEAGWRNRGRQLRRRARSAPVQRGPSASPYYRRAGFPDYDWYYPRYTGAFHARYFSEYGYPSGDRGIRGTAW